MLNFRIYTYEHCHIRCSGNARRYALIHALTFCKDIYYVCIFCHKGAFPSRVTRAYSVTADLIMQLRRCENNNNNNKQASPHPPMCCTSCGFCLPPCHLRRVRSPPRPSPKGYICCWPGAQIDLRAWMSSSRAPTSVVLPSPEVCQGEGGLMFFFRLKACSTSRNNVDLSKLEDAQNEFLGVPIFASRFSPSLICMGCRLVYRRMHYFLLSSGTNQAVG